MLTSIKDMNDLFIFNKTVRGNSHITKNIPCEDNSGFLKTDSNYIITIADGHGDSTCFRSSIGSKFAVESAIKNLSEFAKIYEEKNDELEKIFSDKDSTEFVLNNLTTQIIDDWNEKVKEDLKQNIVTEEEININCENSQSTKELYLSGNRLNHIYGTTLICGLILKNFLILIQQGDGRCDVLYENGEIEQPIPWDERCETNVTTSMCDNDATESIRYCVINMIQKPVAACFMGSDGIEDSYKNMEGTHCFYRKLSLECLSKQDRFDAYLEKELSQMSMQRSQDDMSVSGIIDLSKISKLQKIYERAIKEYELNEKLEQVDALIKSKTRKHDVLGNRVEQCSKEYEETLEELEKLEQEISDLEERKNAVEKEIDIYNEIVSGKENLNKKKKIFLIKKKEKNTQKELSRTQKLYREKLEEKLAEFDKISNLLNSRNEKMAILRGKFEEIENSKETIFSEYEEYDENYRDLQEQYENLRKQLEDL